MVNGKVKYWKHPTNTNFIFIENRKSPLISIDFWCKAGTIYEYKGIEGCAHFLEHMIFKGNRNLKPGEFDLQIELLGGSSNASTGLDDVHYYVLVPKINFKESLYLLTNLVLTPEFNPNEFKLEKAVIQEEIMQQEDQPEEKLLNILFKTAWGNNPYGRNILGNEKNINAIKIKDLKDFHFNQYSSNNVSIAIAGDLPKNILEICENCILTYPNKNEIILKSPKKYKQLLKHVRKEVILERLEFSRIFIAWQIPEENTQKTLLGFEILASILCDGRNSRLIKPLKEENNLVQSITADINPGEFGSLFLIEACCKNEYCLLVEERINEILREIKKSRPILKKEINRAIRVIKSTNVFNLETSFQLTSYFGNHLLWGRYDPLNEFYKNLKYWNSLKNIQALVNNLSFEKFTLIAYSN